MADKRKRYDRQLRIWGEAGQARLEGATVCVLGCGPTATEALKNLVLGGIGSFTLVDGARVQSADLGNNFLLDVDSLGQSRCCSAAALLRELNDSVAGLFVEEEPSQLIASNPAFFKDFTLVIGTQLSEDSSAALDTACRQYGVPLLLARSFGLFGCARVSVQEHCVVDAKPDSAAADLRLAEPWPELAEYAATFDLAALDDGAHAHVPWAVLLVQEVAAWRAAHGGALPEGSAERSAFKAALAERGRGPLVLEENFKEAAAQVHKLWAPNALPGELRAVLQDPRCSPAEGAPFASDFWAMAAGLRAYLAAEGAGRLPLEGSLPDMTAYTEHYLALQRLYAARAAEEAAAVERHVAAALRRAGRAEDAISREAVRHFCRNSAHLCVLRYSALAPAVPAGGVPGETASRGAGLARALKAGGAEATAAHAYALMAAADRFSASFGRAPGSGPAEEAEQDCGRLRSCCTSVLADWRCPVSVAPDDSLAAEVVRAGGAELHCVGAIMGGIAAQEAIKLLTGQFVPLLGTLIYNGIQGSSCVLEDV